MRIYNWLLKQIFYFRYLILKQDKSPRLNDIIFQPGNCHVWNSFDNWNRYLPWYDPIKWPHQDWNTYGIFKQQYGKFFFKARLDGLVTNKGWPAIWLLDIGNPKHDENTDDNGHYCEIDIELMKNHLVFTQWNNSFNKYQESADVVRSQFANHKLYRSLQKEYHLFLIDWSEEWIKMYINGIKCAQFRNEILVSMQIVMSKCSMSKTIVK
jgi:beta-glucanase (GH16 family)